MNKTKQFKIQTPVGSVESDSGNHFLDLFSIVFIVTFVLVVKKMVNRYVK